ncbi:hypothetical protein, partial [Francisella tularensis]|uniref:hypothetical protein n=1 Tax=Francisella tularensis TaxID=263 RepID=UPI001F32B6CB
NRDNDVSHTAKEIREQITRLVCTLPLNRSSDLVKPNIYSQDALIKISVANLATAYEVAGRDRFLNSF